MQQDKPVIKDRPTLAEELEVQAAEKATAGKATQEEKKPAIAEDLEVKAADQAKREDTYSLTEVGFATGQLLEGMSSFRDKTPDEAVLASRTAIERFKQQNPNASAEMIDKVADKVQGIFKDTVNQNAGTRSDRIVRDKKGNIPEEAAYDAEMARIRGRELQKNSQEQTEAYARGVVEDAESAFPTTLLAISDSPEHAEEEFNVFSRNYVAKARSAGISEDKIQRSLGKQKKIVANTVADALIDSDPEKARAYIRDNAGTIGKSVVSLNKKLNSVILERQKDELVHMNQDELDAIINSPSPLTKAAKNLKMQRVSDPFTAASTTQNFNPLQEGNFREREIQIANASEDMGIDVPFMSLAEVSKMKAAMTQEPQKVEAFIRGLEEVRPETAAAIGRQLGDTALGFLASHPDLDKQLKKEIILGLSSPLAVTSVVEPNPDSMYLDTLTQLQVNKAATLMTKGRGDIVLGTEQLEEVANVHTINSNFLGRGGQKLPLPAGTTAKTFETVADNLLSDISELERFTNGKVAGARDSNGKIVDFDKKALKWVAVTPGIYALQIEGRYLYTGDEMLRVNMKGAINGE